MMPAVSGGLNPVNLPQTLDVCGPGALFLVGRGVSSHPDGTVAGVKAMEQAVDAWTAHRDLGEYSAR